MSKDRRLGKGLAALLGQAVDDSHETESEGPATIAFDATIVDAYRPSSAQAHSPSGAQSASSTTPRKAPRALAPSDFDQLDADPSFRLQVEKIDANPFQPRREFNPAELASMAESLKTHDMLQPVLVRKMGDRYQLISGERRLRAAIEAGWTSVPARIREADDRLVAELAIVENLQRKDLNAIEKALSFKRYLDEHRCLQEDLAKRLGIDRSTIANLVRLLELPDEIQTAVANGAVSAGHARALLPLGEEREQLEFSRRIQDEGLSVRETERQVQERVRQADGYAADDAADGAAETDNSAPSPAKPRALKSEQIAALEQELRAALGCRIDIRQTSKGRGKIVIHFAGHEDFERVRDQVMGGARERAA